MELKCELPLESVKLREAFELIKYAMNIVNMEKLYLL